MADINTDKTEKSEKDVKTVKVEKKDGFFKRTWKKLTKLCRDTAGEMKKGVWTPKDEVRKSTVLVLAAVVVTSVVIGLIDFGAGKLISFLAGLIG